MLSSRLPRLLRRLPLRPPRLLVKKLLRNSRKRLLPLKPRKKPMRSFQRKKKLRRPRRRWMSQRQPQRRRMLPMKQNLRLRLRLRIFRILLPLPRRFSRRSRVRLTPLRLTRKPPRKLRRMKPKSLSRRKSRRPLLNNRHQRQKLLRSHGDLPAKSGLLTCQSTISPSELIR